MSTDRTSQINRILEKRKPLVRKLTEIETSLQNLSSALNDLEKHRNQLLSLDIDGETIGRLQELNLSTIQSDISDEVNALSKLRNRFSRNTLNIGVVGRARQGKSRLLQSLSGLSTNEIPTGDRSHCTGVRSTIHHNPMLRFGFTLSEHF
jgi:chromosome segregation ATPase